MRSLNKENLTEISKTNKNPNRKNKQPKHPSKLHEQLSVNKSHQEARRRQFWVYLCEDTDRNQFALKAIGRDLLNEDKERLFNNEVHCLQKLRIKAKHLEDENEEYQPALRRCQTFDQEQIFEREQGHQLFHLNGQNQWHWPRQYNPENESHVIQYIHHQKVLNLPFQSRSYSCHALFLELASNGCLANYLKSSSMLSFPISVIRTIAKEILLGLKEMHNAGIVHRDVKEDNIVFGENYSLKLIDLSFAGDNNEIICGTDKYLAPEQIKRRVQVLSREILGNGVNHNEHSSQHTVKPVFEEFAKLDSFSTGVVIFRLATRKFPFQKATTLDYSYKYIVNQEYEKFWENMPIAVSEDKEVVRHVDEGNQVNMLCKEFEREIISEQQQKIHGEEDGEQIENKSQTGRVKMRASTVSAHVSTGHQSHIQSDQKYKNNADKNCQPEEQHCQISGNIHESDQQSPKYHNVCSNKSYDKTNRSDSKSFTPLSFDEQLTQLKDFIQGLLAYDNHQRLSVDQALNHSFLAPQNHFAASGQMKAFFNQIRQS